MAVCGACGGRGFITRVDAKGKTHRYSCGACSGTGKR